MKKLFLLLAMAGTMVACGGNDKKDDKQGASVEEQAEAAKEQVLSVEEQAKAYANELKAFLKISEERKAWYEGLSDADKATADKVMEELLKEDEEKRVKIEEQGASAKEQVLSVEEQVTVYFNKMKAISFLDSDGQQELEELINEMTAWDEGLSDADREIARKVMEELLKAEAEKQVKIEEQAEAYAVEMNAASKAGDIEKMAQIAGEMQEWYNTLSPDEQMFAEAIVARQGGSVEEQAKAYVNEMKAAEEAGDYEKFQKIAEESGVWYDGLSDADKAAVDKVLESMM